MSITTSALALRHAVSETNEKIKLQENGREVAYLVIEESKQLTPVDMVKGECSIVDEVMLRDGEKVAMLAARAGPNRQRPPEA